MPSGIIAASSSWRPPASADPDTALAEQRLELRVEPRDGVDTQPVADAQPGALVAALAFAPLVTTDHAAVAKTTSSDDWVEYSPEKLAQLSSEGKPVFVDFTAAWCVTCQVNKRVALTSDRVISAFAAAGVVRMRADWTTRDDRITQALAQFGRNGVPLYVLYDTKGQPTVLPEILTEGTVLAALDRIKLVAR